MRDLFLLVVAAAFFYCKVLAALTNSKCRCSPGAQCWPTAAQWATLNTSVGGNLFKPVSPMSPCLLPGANQTGPACQAALKALSSDPFYLQTMGGATQSTGWFNAWNSSTSVYAIAARSAAHVTVGVLFAARYNLRLVVKATGHDYLGRSNAPGSLLIWTHHMRDLSFVDSFQTCNARGATTKLPVAVLSPGLTWVDVYLAATDRNLYVQGGGCTSVGVVGFTLGGGFGSFAKMFGSGAANVVQAKVVLANGTLVTASHCQNPDLFFALRGAGHGLGVVVELTVRTHPLPSTMGSVSGEIVANSRPAFDALIANFLEFALSNLSNPNWGETVHIDTNKKTLSISLLSVNLTGAQAMAAWAPFRAKLAARAKDYTVGWSPTETFGVSTFTGAEFWGQARARGAPASSFDPKEPNRAFFWPDNLVEIGLYWSFYISRWTRADQIFKNATTGAAILTQLATATDFDLAFNKGQYGASKWVQDEMASTSLHPSLLASPALMLTGGGIGHYSPLVSDSAQLGTSTIGDIIKSYGVNWKRAVSRDLAVISKAMAVMRNATPGAGTYVNEADYWEPNFRDSLWGSNYPRLLAVKQRVDPQGLFYCHHCVGSEQWTSDGMCRV